MEPLHPFEQLMYDRFAEAIWSWDLLDTGPICLVYLDYGSSGASADAENREFLMQGYITLHCLTQSVRDTNLHKNEFFSHGVSDSQSAVPDFPDYGENFSKAQMSEIDLRNAWCAANGISPDGKDDSGQNTYDEALIDALCAQACSRVGRCLHDQGILIQKFGQPIPIVIETHDYAPNPESGPVAATRSANPPGLARQYEEQMLRRTYARIDAYDDLVASIKTKPPADQAAMWADALENLCLNLSSPFAMRLKDLAKTGHAVADELVAIGPAAVPVLISLIERYSQLPECRPIRPDEETEHSKKFFERMRAKNPDWPRIPTTPTPEGDLVSEAIRILHKIGTAENTDVERVYTMLRKLFPNATDVSLRGGNVCRLAGLLHKLQPDRFPFATNPFTNYRDFGLQKSGEES